MFGSRIAPPAGGPLLQSLIDTCHSHLYISWSSEVCSKDCSRGANTLPIGWRETSRSKLN